MFIWCTMFDWPEQSHTSPNRISFSTILFLPFISIECGPPAFAGDNCTCQLPAASAAARYVFPFTFTVIFSFGEAHPHTVSFVSRCRIMLSLISAGSLTCAVSITGIIIVSVRHAFILYFICCAVYQLLQKPARLLLLLLLSFSHQRQPACSAMYKFAPAAAASPCFW